jgi:hypothetical protein
MNEDKGRKTLETRKDKTMKQNIGYQIDFVEGKIIVSKKFLKEASNVATTAYSELVQIRKDYPDFMIEPRQIAKRENKMTYGKLTYQFMRDYIKTKDNAEAILAEYENTRKLAKFQNAQYVFVKKWFLGLYGDEFKREEDEERETA